MGMCTFLMIDSPQIAHSGYFLSYSVNENGEGSTFDHCSSSAIRLNSGTVLYLREVNKFLALVCILREENFTKQGLIDYNFQCFRKSIQDVFIHRLSDATRVSSTNVNTPYGSSNTAQDGEESAVTQAASEVNVYANSYPNDVSEPMPMSNKHTPTGHSMNNSSYKQQTPTVHMTNAPSHRKYAILPATSTVSSLPNHQMYHPASVEKNPNLHPSVQMIPQQQWTFN